MAGEGRNKFDRIWTPEGAPRRGPLTTYYRSTLVMAAASALYAIGLPASLLAWLFLHWPLKLVVGVILAGAVINLAAQVSRVWYLFCSRGWIAPDGRTIRPTKHPVRFWRTAIIQLIALLVWLGASAVALLILLS